MTQAFRVNFFLEKIRDGIEVLETEWMEFVSQCEEIPIEQVSAFLVHAFHKGLSQPSVVSLTKAMAQSGKTLSWDTLDRPVLDKHSTGGIGDKISLCLAPLLVSLGFAVPMISGRGLGFTGGTLDKLESITGFSTNLSLEKLQSQVKTLGMAFGQQTDDIAPADRLFYAIRDITGTVESIALITASILSKKLAENPRALILDVKWGSGAFMEKLHDAEALAKSLGSTARGAGVVVKAMITNMNQPLGWVSGHSSEVAEAVAVLKNEPSPDDTRELTLQMAAQSLLLLGMEKDHNVAYQKAVKALQSGEPFEVWCRVVRAQGGETSSFQEKQNFPLRLDHRIEIEAPADGYIEKLNGRAFGKALICAGAGRVLRTDRINPWVSWHHPLKVGQKVKRGEIIATLYSNQAMPMKELNSILSNAVTVGPHPPTVHPLIEKVLTWKD